MGNCLPSKDEALKTLKQLGSAAMGMIGALALNEAMAKTAEEYVTQPCPRFTPLFFFFFFVVPILVLSEVGQRPVISGGGVYKVPVSATCQYRPLSEHHICLGTMFVRLHCHAISCL